MIDQDIRESLSRNAASIHRDPAAWDGIARGVKRAKQTRALSIGSSAMVVLSALALVISVASPKAATIADFAGGAVDAGTFKMRTVTTTSGGAYGSTTTAEFDLRRKLAHFVMDMPAPKGMEENVPEGFLHQEFIITAEHVYRHDPKTDKWIKTRLDDATAQFTQSPFSPATDPAHTFERLREDAKDVSAVGSERIEGMDTTHYALTIDVEKLISELPSSLRAPVRSTLAGQDEIHFDLWVGEDGLLYREAVKMRVGTGSNRQRHEVETENVTDFFDYGVPVSIRVPTDDQLEPEPQPTMSTFTCTASSDGHEICSGSSD